MKKQLFSALLMSAMLAMPLFAAADDDDDANCPAGTPYPVSYETKFGPEVIATMRCLENREDVRVVMQVNIFKDSKGRPYGFRNLPMMMKDYTQANGIDPKEVDIRVIVHGGGYPFVLDPAAANPHADAVKNDQVALVNQVLGMGIKVYLCLNTAASKGIMANQLLPGVQTVTGGLTALADFQDLGYSYIQP